MGRVTVRRPVLTRSADGERRGPDALAGVEAGVTLGCFLRATTMTDYARADRIERAGR